METFGPPALDGATTGDAEQARGGGPVPVESDGHNEGNPRLYELIENAPKTGKSPTVWAFPQLVEYLKVAGQPVQGPWPPHQEPRPDPTAIDSRRSPMPDPLSARCRASRRPTARSDRRRADHEES